MSFELRRGDRVVVTGAAGFIGSAVTFLKTCRLDDGALKYQMTAGPWKVVTLP